MAKPQKKEQKVQYALLPDPANCPFREFKDNEFAECLGVTDTSRQQRSPRTAVPQRNGNRPQTGQKSLMWVDDQVQPLPRSVKSFVDKWERPEILANILYDNTLVAISDETDAKMNIKEYQYSHGMLLEKSLFIRKVLSTCFILERSEYPIEHCGENFSFTIGPEGWRAKYHIYSHGIKPGGGAQHKPSLSKNGCYIVRLYFFGMWRSVLVSDLVPINENGVPLLPFAPFMSSYLPIQTSKVVFLWPLLICKALLKLAAPSSLNEELFIDEITYEDDVSSNFSIFHALTGGMTIRYNKFDEENVWEFVTKYAPLYVWDDDYELNITVKSKINKRVPSKSTREITSKKLFVKRQILIFVLHESRDQQVHMLPGITPACSLNASVTIGRDIPLKRPLPEPELTPWKYYRWRDWAIAHGLYDDYLCPRDRYLKLTGLMKLSYAPYLLDIPSTDTIKGPETIDKKRADKSRQEKSDKSKISKLEKDDKGAKGKRSDKKDTGKELTPEDHKDWVLFTQAQKLLKSMYIIFYPSMFEYYVVASHSNLNLAKPKVGMSKATDIQALNCCPMYVELDSGEPISLRISLSSIHPNVFNNTGHPKLEYIEKSYMFLEEFLWFVDVPLPTPKAYLQTRAYDSLEITLDPGRHYFRLWAHSPIAWHVAFLTESHLLVGPQDVIMTNSATFCPWANIFLSNLGDALSNWIQAPRIATKDYSELYEAYEPDLTWNREKIGHTRKYRHWMFQQALASLLSKKITEPDLFSVFATLRRYFRNPNFGKPAYLFQHQHIINKAAFADELCDCILPEAEACSSYNEEILSEQEEQPDPRTKITPETMELLLRIPRENDWVICDLATDEIPCGLLKEIRDDYVNRNEAATKIQTFWRGAFARICTNETAIASQEVIKRLMDTAFGSDDVLLNLMNEFFSMYPGAKSAYTISSGLNGVVGLQQYQNNVILTIDSNWIPFFQGVFHCHAQVKVHFDISSSVENNIIYVYDNDLGEQLKFIGRAHIVYEFQPNVSGYTVIGHGYSSVPCSLTEINWQLTVLTSLDNIFHICDSQNAEICKPLSLPSVHKFHIFNDFVPNRRNILGGIQITVMKTDAVSFKVTASAPNLLMEANVSYVDEIEGKPVVVYTCSGRGSVCCNYLKMEASDDIHSPMAIRDSMRNQSISSDIQQQRRGPQRTKNIKKSASRTNKNYHQQQQPKVYTVEITAPEGWPLNIIQWKRVTQIRDAIGVVLPLSSIETNTGKKSNKPTTVPENKNEPPYEVNPGNAYIQIECTSVITGDTKVQRDETREKLYESERKSWAVNDPVLGFHRKDACANTRYMFRKDYLEPLPPEEKLDEQEAMEELYDVSPAELPPTPNPTDVGSVENSNLGFESDEEKEPDVSLTMPDELKDKFIPLDFVLSCTNQSEGPIISLTQEMRDKMELKRIEDMQAGLRRMEDLEQYNQRNVLKRQVHRRKLLEGLYIEGEWNPKLATVLEQRDMAIVLEKQRLVQLATQVKVDSKSSKLNTPNKTTKKNK